MRADAVAPVLVRASESERNRASRTGQAARGQTPDAKARTERQQDVNDDGDASAPIDGARLGSAPCAQGCGVLGGQTGFEPILLGPIR